MRKHRQHKTLCRHDFIISLDKALGGGRNAILEVCTLCPAKRNRVVSDEKLKQIRRKRKCFDYEMLTFG